MLVYKDNFITEDDKQTYLHNIENSFFNGMSGVKYTMNYLHSPNITLSTSSIPEFKNHLSIAVGYYKKIDPGFLNKMVSNETYSLDLKKFLEKGEISSTNPKDLITKVEDCLNKAIIDAKREDSKTNRLKEKKEVLNFWKSNRDQVKNLLEYRNSVIVLKNDLIDHPNFIKYWKY